jgi:hypothetical protein
MIQQKNFSQRFRFCDWPNIDIPLITAGVYVIWENKQLVCCGMSGREIEKYKYSNLKKKYGLINRLNSHASGRLSGDQFCVYVANRIVIPSLDPHMLEQFRDGTMNLDQLTKQYVRDRLEYQAIELHIKTLPSPNISHGLFWLLNRSEIENLQTQ